MGSGTSLENRIRNSLQRRDLRFRDFMESALYDPEEGYYGRPRNPVGKAGDYVTAPSLSPVFPYALGRLVSEFLSRAGDVVSTVVDVGCGDGSLLHSLWASFCGAPAAPPASARFYGVDRTLSRVDPGLRTMDPALRFVRTMDEVPADGARLVVSNELFDAFPFARLVQRTEGLHELTVVGGAGELDWGETDADPAYEKYLATRSIELAEGQFADISLDWEVEYATLARSISQGLIVTFDYGYPQKQLFDNRVRRYGTAAAYHQHRVHRDLLARPGQQDLTAHVNFDDLIRAGEREGLETLYFDRQAKFLLALGAAEHDLLRPIEDMDVQSLEEGVDLRERREEARRLLLPDGIGDEIRVLVQRKGLGGGEWSFQRPLFHR